MCLIFYSYNNKNIKKHLDKYISFSKHSNNQGLYGGIGVAWFGNSSHRWGCSRQLKVYNDVSSLPEEMLSNDLVVGHIRERYDGDAEIAIENVHPFSYKNQIFLHNGGITDFSTKRSVFLSDIDKDLRSFIKGDTDTEYMFYMFLTIKKKLESREIHVSEEDILIQTTEHLLDYLKHHYKQFRSNFVYANKSHSIIIRYAFSTDARPLYFNGQTSRNKLLISSLPVMDNYKLIPTNTIIIVNHNEKN